MSTLSLTPTRAYAECSVLHKTPAGSRIVLTKSLILRRTPMTRRQHPETATNAFHNLPTEGGESINILNIFFSTRPQL